MKSILILAYLFFCLSFVVAAQSNESHDNSSQDHTHFEDLANEKTHGFGHVNTERDAHGEYGHNDEQGRSEDDTTEIVNAMALQMGIEIERVGPQPIHQTFTSYGRLTTAPEHTSHVRARFPGVVRSVAVNIGDQVDIGDLLAVIESNESLKRYEVHAPIRGTIIQRHANAGEMTQEQVLFSISSFESLWAELRIFPSQQQLLSIGQPVHVSAGEKRFDSQISHLLPAEGALPYLIARAKISDEKNRWFPGLMVEGKIVINEFNAPLAVKKSALQIIDGRTGIFIKDGDSYRFITLVLGQSDDTFFEVISGVETNSEYIAKNSYLIKADIEKSEAEHEH